LIDSRKPDVVGYENAGDFRGVVLEDALEFFSKKAMVEIVKLPSKKKVTRKAISSTIDGQSDKMIHILMKGDINDLKEISPVIKKVIKPLYLFLDKEVLLYAQLKGLEFSEDNKVKRDEISMFIDDLEKGHPEIKRAIINSYLELYEEEN